MSKILITFIGTGSLNTKNEHQREYRKAKYLIENQEYETSFVADALFRHYKLDTVYFIGTAKSMWEEVYSKFSGEEQNEDLYLELAEIVEKSNKDTLIDEPKLLSAIRSVEESLPQKPKIFLIRYGLNEEELWQNFKILNEILEKIPENAEVYLDITHSFRSLPIFALVSIFYLQSVKEKKITLKGIFYGMLDIISETNGRAHVINLEPIATMIEWIKAAQSFKDYGMGDNIIPLLESEHIRKRIQEFSNFLQLNYISEIATQVSQLNSIKSQLDGLTIPAQLTLMPIIERFTKIFQGKEKIWQKQLALAEWHAENKHYGLAYIDLVEAIVSYVCEREKLKIDILDERDKAKDKIRADSKYEVISKIYKKASKIRNKIAHAVPDKQADKLKDIEALKKYIKEFKEFVKNA